MGTLRGGGQFRTPGLPADARRAFCCYEALVMSAFVVAGIESESLAVFKSGTFGLAVAGRISSKGPNRPVGETHIREAVLAVCGWEEKSFLVLLTVRLIDCSH